MTYLLKLSVVWLLFLVLFEVLYQRNGKYTLNRVYLLLSIAFGFVLPLLQLPSNTPTVITNARHFYQEAPAAMPLVTTFKEAAIQKSAVEVGNAPIGHNLDYVLILQTVYSICVLVLLGKCLYEVAKIVLLLHSRPIQLMNGHKVVATGKVHPPYSFMGIIFMADPTAYTTPELEYIICHEAAHGERRHWLDLWIMQLVCIIFWFHPLVWRYRYLLQMQHEYEADEIAASNDPYTYGHFLLQQTLLKGVPPIAHSFHFSPIKTRIKMLTKKHSFRSAGWKYTLLLPVLLGCSFLMAKEDENTTTGISVVLKSNETRYKDNTFAWRAADTVVLKDKSYAEKSNAMGRRQVVYSMNDEPVYQNEQLKTPARYGTKETDYTDYVRQAFFALRKGTADSLAWVNIYGLVVNKEGNVVLYDLRFARPFPKFLGSQKLWEPYPHAEPVLNSYMEKIMQKSPKWKPAMVNGIPVNSFVSIIATGGC